MKLSKKARYVLYGCSIALFFVTYYLDESWIGWIVIIVAYLIGFIAAAHEDD